MGSLIKMYRWGDKTGNVVYYKNMYSSRALPSILIDEDSSIYRFRNNHIHGAVLTQEMNRAGKLTLKVRNNLFSELTDPKWFISAGSTYINDGLPGVYNNSTNMWFGLLSSYTKTPTETVITYDGELSWLDKIVLAPYSSSSKRVQPYIRELIDKYNSALSDYVEQDIYYPPKFQVMFSDAYNWGETAERGNSSVTTIWKELNAKVLSRYDVRLCATSYWMGWAGSHRARELYFVNLTDTPIGIISTDEIVNISFSNNVSSKVRTIHLYGKKQDESAEGDTSRVYAKATYSGDWQSDIVLPMSESYKIYDDIATSATLEEHGAENIIQNIINADSVQVTLKPGVGENLWLGEVYTIVDPKIGLNKKFRLTKRTLDLLNPAKNTYTFGKIDLISAK